MTFHQFSLRTLVRGGGKFLTLSSLPTTSGPFSVMGKWWAKLTWSRLRSSGRSPCGGVILVLSKKIASGDERTTGAKRRPLFSFEQPSRHDEEAPWWWWQKGWLFRAHLRYASKNRSIFNQETERLWLDWAVIRGFFLLRAFPDLVKHYFFYVFK